MKSATKLMVLVLTLALVSWAQTATPTPAAPGAQKAPAAQSETKTGCPCCQKMADSKNAMSCCAHQKDAKSGTPMSCCGGKDGKSCMKGDKSNASCADCQCCRRKGLLCPVCQGDQDGYVMLRPRTLRHGA